MEITQRTSVSLNLGDRRQLTVVVRDERGNVIGCCIRRDPIAAADLGQRPPSSM
jgi:hypothetical protein